MLRRDLSWLYVGLVLLYAACDGGSAGSNDNGNARCGDGTVDPTEACDGVNLGWQTCALLGYPGGELACASDCTFDTSGCEPVPECGDGTVGSGEVCDDGNTVDNDGCSADCLSDETCGNGYVDALIGEACDDGNTVDSDGCSADCQSDETCGNGYVDALIGEACDDGNIAPWDGCSLSCRCMEWQVNTYATGKQAMARLASAADGSFVVTYRSDDLDGDGPGVFAQRYDSLGLPLGSELQVNTYWLGIQGNNRIAMAPDGRFVVVWTSDDQDGSGRGVYGQRFDSTGVAVGSEIHIPETTLGEQELPAVDLAVDGSFVVAWPSPDGAGLGIFARRFNSDGTPAGGEFQVNTYTAGSQRSPHIHLDDTGGFVVTYASDGQDGDGHGIFGRRYDSSGNALGLEFGINTFTAGTQWRHAADVTGDGTLMVVWPSDGQDPSGDWAIFGRLYDPTGAALGPEFQVSVDRVQGQDALTWVDFGSNGRSIVAWTSADDGGNGTSIVFRAFAADGIPSAPPVTANSYAADDQLNPSVDIRGDGSFIIAWSSFGQDGSDHGIFARLYDAQFGPLCPGP